MSVHQVVAPAKAGLSKIFAPLLGAAAVFGCISWLNGAQFGRRFLEKYPPDWSGEGLARTAACASAAALLAVALRRIGGPTRDLSDPAASQKLLAITGLATLALIVFTEAAMLIAPGELIGFVAELGPIALLQEAMIAAAAVLAAIAAFSTRGRAVPKVGPLAGSAVIALMSLALLVLTLEETSYGQHYFDWATPETFAANIQNETNLHNFYTYRFELVFYSAAMLAFVVLPFAWPANPPALVAGLSFLVPPRGFAVLGLPVCAYLYNGWNIVPLQAGFFLALAVAVLMVRDLWRPSPGNAALVILVAGVLLAAQLAVFATGHLLAEHYEADEIRETHIALLCLAYAAWLAGKIRRMPRADTIVR